jgi:hypothetical protein
VAHEYHGLLAIFAFMARNEVSSMGDFFDVHRKTLTHLQAYLRL